MESIQTNIEKMDAQLEQWGAKLDELVAKAEAAGAEAKDHGREHIDELRAKHRAAKARLDELQAAGAEKWETFKDDIESAWHEVETGFKKLKS
jgi:IS5 family transposase